MFNQFKIGRRNSVIEIGLIKLIRDMSGTITPDRIKIPIRGRGRFRIDENKKAASVKRHVTITRRSANCIGTSVHSSRSRSHETYLRVLINSLILININGRETFDACLARYPSEYSYRCER